MSEVRVESLIAGYLVAQVVAVEDCGVVDSVERQITRFLMTVFPISDCTVLNSSQGVCSVNH